MPDGLPQSISVADAKRRFADVLGSVRHNGERYVIERNGTPMAALVPLADLERTGESPRSGFLALVDAFAEAPELAAALAASVLIAHREGRSPGAVLGDAMAAYGPAYPVDRGGAVAAAGPPRVERKPRPVSEIPEHELLGGPGTPEPDGPRPRR